MRVIYTYIMHLNYIDDGFHTLCWLVKYLVIIFNDRSVRHRYRHHHHHHRRRRRRRGCRRQRKKETSI